MNDGLWVEAMKSRALALPERVEAMRIPVFEKVPFHACIRKIGYVPANERT